MRFQVAVVVLVAVLLAGLVLAGVVRVREAAARMSCQNGLHQLGIAVQNYHECTGHLPPLAGGSGDLRSVFGTLIPFLEATHRQYTGRDSPADGYHAHSSTPFTFRRKDGEAATQYGGDANQRWSLFLCPADATADGLRDVLLTLPDGSGGYYTTGSYAAKAQLKWGTKTPALASSNAILFAERPQVCRTATGEAVHNLWGVGFNCPQMPVFPPSSDTATPFQRTGPERLCDPRLPGSPHADGMQAVRGDSSVRLLSFRTTPREFWSACGVE